MENNEKVLYEDYKIARDMVQLREAHVINCSSKLLKNLNQSIDYSLKLELGRKHVWKEENMVKGFLRATVIIENKEDKTEIAQLFTEIEGDFFIESKSINKEEYDIRIGMQLVPQLLPYARIATSNLALLMGLPKVTLPTMDVLESIRKNRSAHSDAGRV